jgi:hypothetical protein
MGMGRCSIALARGVVERARLDLPVPADNIAVDLFVGEQQRRVHVGQQFGLDVVIKYQSVGRERSAGKSVMRDRTLSSLAIITPILGGS